MLLFLFCNDSIYQTVDYQILFALDSTTLVLLFNNLLNEKVEENNYTDIDL